MEPLDRTESTLFDLADFGLPERDDFGLPECTDLGLPERTDFGLPDARLFGLTDLDDVRRLADFVRELLGDLLDLALPECSLGDLLDLALPECSDAERLRCEPTALGLRDFCDGELDRERDDFELAEACEPASEPAGLTERFGE